jgi:histone H3/H4
MESEAGLPHATVKQIIQRVINPTYKSCATGITQIVAELAQSFIQLTSELAYAECTGSGKKTIMPEHVVAAMKKCNFDIDPKEIMQFLEDLNKLKAVSFI